VQRLFLGPHTHSTLCKNLHITDHLRDLGAPLEYDECVGAADPPVKEALARVAVQRPATALHAAEYTLTPDAAARASPYHCVRLSRCDVCTSVMRGAVALRHARR
jgi:hypothetical protein